jgi:hypothetical protein
MADLQTIRGRIRDIAERRNNVALAEIEWVIRQLGKHGYTVGSADARHGKLFRVGTHRFMVNHHNPGSRQVKSYSVKDFINAMIDLGLYD